MVKKNYYDVLGVGKDSTFEEIKKKYLELAKKHHPDRSKDKSKAEEKFKEISEAYSVLSDPEKRKNYDYGGQESGPWDSYSDSFKKTFDVSSFFSTFEETGFSGFFDEFFFGTNKRQTARDRKSPKNIFNLYISLEDSYFGGVILAKIPKDLPCTECTEQDYKKTIKCSSCGGAGKVAHEKGNYFNKIIYYEICKLCSGRGHVYSVKCKSCNNTRIKTANVDHKIKVYKGIGEGEILYFPGKGNEHPGKKSGDLYIKINIKQIKNYWREGIDLICKKFIKYTYFIDLKPINISLFGGKLNEIITIPKNLEIGTPITVNKKGFYSKQSGRVGNLILYLFPFFN